MVRAGYRRSIDKIDGILVEVDEDFLGEFTQSCFGVTHGGRRVSVHGTEVTLSIYQRVAHHPFLGQSYHGKIDGRVAVRMVLTEYFADDSG